MKKQTSKKVSKQLPLHQTIATGKKLSGFKKAATGAKKK